MEDGWYGLGFCHGQDRAVQLEGLLRLVRGTLAQAGGPRLLPIDRLSRRIGFVRSGAAQFRALSVNTRRDVAAYARGLYDGATLGSPRRPHEFALAGVRPARYSPEDVLAVGKLVAFSLSSNWDVELARLKILQEDGPEALEALEAARYRDTGDFPGFAREFDALALGHQGVRSLGGVRRHVERLGRRSGPNGHGKTDSRQRPTPAPGTAAELVLGPREHAGVDCGGRELRRRAPVRRGAQRLDRVGRYRRAGRQHGPVPRARRPRRAGVCWRAMSSPGATCSARSSESRAARQWWKMWS